MSFKLSKSGGGGLGEEQTEPICVRLRKVEKSIDGDCLVQSSNGQAPKHKKLSGGG